jgi:hypothetical protein
VDKVEGEYYAMLPCPPMYSFDHAPIHEASGWEHIIHDASKRLPLPPYSADMHRVVEHSHGIIASEFQKWLYKNPTLNQPVDYQNAVREIAYKHITPASVEADVKKLKPLYSKVATPKAEGGTGGEWPGKKMR